ncbi:MAG: DNA methyltransferase [Candidatus Thorarchaeota archaeon]|jgi:site-specific DNA-methyltransferase (adenine-specific)
MTKDKPVIDERMMEIPIAEIDDSERRRKEYRNIESLGDSLNAKGLIHPILVTTGEKLKYKLVAGGRRLAAARSIKWETISAIHRANLTEEELRELEIEENIEREPMLWQEVVNARGELFVYKQAALGLPKGRGPFKQGYSLRDLAKDLNLSSRGRLSMDIQLYYAMMENPGLSRYATKDMALKVLERERETEILRELAKRDASDGQQRIVYLSQAKVPSDVELQEWNLFRENCVETMKRMDDEMVDLVITDPPWGLGSGIRRLAFPRSEFRDTAKELVFLKTTVLPELYRVMKADSHLYMFLSWDARTYISKELFKLGFDVQTMPLIAIKPSGGSADLSEPTYIPNYETILFVRKGARILNTFSKCTFDWAPVHHGKRIHTAEKPVSLLQNFIALSSVEYELVYDPYAGSGSTLEAALRMNRRAMGSEMDETIHKRAEIRLDTLTMELTEGKDAVALDDEEDDL